MSLSKYFVVVVYFGETTNTSFFVFGWLVCVCVESLVETCVCFHYYNGFSVLAYTGL